MALMSSCASSSDFASFSSFHVSLLMPVVSMPFNLSARRGLAPTAGVGGSEFGGVTWFGGEPSWVTWPVWFDNPSIAWATCAASFRIGIF